MPNTNASSAFISGFSLLQQVDYSKLFEIAKHVKENNALDKFGENPLEYAKQVNGFVPPDGFHMHVADKDNKYYPEEDDAITQLMSNSDEENWIRVEARAGYKDLACIICFGCSGIT